MIWCVNVNVYLCTFLSKGVSSNSQMLRNRADSEEPLELSEQHFRWMTLDAALEDGICGSKIVVEKPVKGELHCPGRK